MNPNSPSFNSKAVATPAKNPDCSSAKYIETVFSPTFASNSAPSLPLFGLPSRITNNGKEDFIINRNDRVAQGVFMKYLTVDDEDEIINERTGGIGSTGKGDDFNE